MYTVYLSEVGVVNVSHDVEQKLLHFLQNNFEVCGKLVPVFGREHRLVIDNLKKYFSSHSKNILFLTRKTFHTNSPSARKS